MPAFNEAKLVGAAIGAVPDFVDHLIVVDDSSVDGTSDVVRMDRRSVLLLRHETNRGVGAAISTGCKQALKLGVDFTAVMAADGQMDPGDLPVLLAPLLADEADYAKGSRLDWPAARELMPRHRWLGNRLFSALTRRALGVEVQDSQCGYLAMSRRCKLAVDWDRLWKSYGYPNDLLSRLSIAGLRMCEVPVRPIYGREQSGIRLRHVLFIIPFVIARASARGLAQRRGLARSSAPG